MRFPVRRMLCLTVALCAVVAADAREARQTDTIKSLERRRIEINPGEVIVNSSDLARDTYREFLELASTDPELRAEALRRLGDLELESADANQVSDNIEALQTEGYDHAADFYKTLLETYPDYPRNDTVRYQLARAYETAGKTDEALATLDELIELYPTTPYIDEVQFRRGEMQFVRKNYIDAEASYQAVIDYGDQSRYYEQSLYKLGWSQFKLAMHEDSLDPFFELLDRKIGDIDFKKGQEQFESLSRAEQEMVEDTFRVLSISFSYMEGAESIEEFLARHGDRDYAYVIYMNLGDLYLSKERYVDAAATYEAFVDSHPNHPQAPLLQVEVIEAYKQGGFPSLVLDGKKDFADRYALGGEFWAANVDSENTAVSAQLKANMNDLAQYYHAEAQANGKQSDYNEAANWYRKYMSYFPDDPDSAATNFLLAEILYEMDDYAGATKEYERTAYAYPPHEKSAEAGYAALLGYRETEGSLEGPARAEWHREYLDSALRFSDTFPDHPEAGAVLTAVAEDLFEQGEFDLAIAVAQSVVAKQPPVKRELLRNSWTVIALSHFDLENYAAAEQAYYQLRAFTPPDDATANDEIKERIASSIYKQGEQARDAGDLETAVGHFTRLGEEVPDSDIRATADYDAAAALINMSAWDRASGVLEDFRRKYPDSEFADDVSQKLAVTYLESGQGVDAAREFERIAVADASTEDIRREALWKASELYEEAGAMGDEQRVLTDIVARYPDPVAESIEARQRLLEIAEVTGNRQQRTNLLHDLVEADANAGAQRSDRTRYLAATASIELAEPIRQRFVSMRLTQPLAQSVKQKRTMMEDVIRAYTKAAEYGVAEVTTEATYYLGDVYKQFSTDLAESERPAGLDELALDEYELLLEEQIFPFEEKAIDLYMTNTDRAADGVYDEWVVKSFERLASLVPARYAKMERSEDVVTTLN